jgi:CHAT domain-containing protein
MLGYINFLARIFKSLLGNGGKVLAMLNIDRLIKKTKSPLKKWLVCFCVAVLITVSIGAVNAANTPLTVQSANNGAQLVEKAKILYQEANYHEAIATLQKALKQYRSQQPPNLLQQGMVLNNLALAYQQLGQWQQVEENIAASGKIIKNLPESQEKTLLSAQAGDIQGNLQLATGKAQEAYETWQQGESSYSQLGDDSGVIRSLINQAQALQVLGFYRRGMTILEEVEGKLETQPNSLTKAVGLRSLGNLQFAVGNLSQAQQNLENSYQIAERFRSPGDMSAALFSLGNVAKSQYKYDKAISYYRQGAENAPNEIEEIRAQLNLLTLLIEQNQDYQGLLKEVRNKIVKLPANATAVSLKINYVSNFLQLYQPETDRQILIDAIAEAEQLGDKSAQAYGLKTLGRLYEFDGKWQPAREATQQALVIAQEINARDIAYQAQWQLGRLLTAQQQEESAIAAYQEAVNTLQSLRSDLVAVNPEIQFTFRENIEPIYREYVSLLLNSPKNKDNNLNIARNAIDSLQLAELENFFRATCLNAQPVVIDELTDQENSDTAIIYPIVLADRFETILKLPQEKLRHYSTPIDNARKTERILTRLTQSLTQKNSRETLPLAQQVYNWLIAPAADDLAASKVKTLVFVLDSPLRNIPMSVLHDGQQYLIEKYAVAITPGLQLLQPQAIAKQQLKALTGGLTAARGGFPPLEYVAEELKTIQSQVAETEQLIDRNFTEKALQAKIAQVPFLVVHLATHGQFSSQAEKTFILTWDDRINVNQFNQLLATGDRDEAIELLVLSACETLTGDDRAALGLAGVAVRAGARSTLATLWRVNDEATSLLMGQFYQQLGDKTQTITKAEALRQAQLALLKSDRFNLPNFWASYVLVGNWL